jgi:glutamate-1-semialdehyde 2,1-aminomutase
MQIPNPFGGQDQMDQPKSHDELVEALIEQSPKSGELWKSSQDLVPGGLLSMARKFKPYPFYTQRGQGPYIWDVDENRYIDCCTSYGVLLLGHRPQVVLDALNEQEEWGTAYGTPHPLEIKFAERFATMQGIRIMRAYTGKDKIAKFESAYHGWHDYASWNMGMDPETMGPPDRPNLVPSSAGIPKAVKDTMLMLPVNDHAFTLIEENADELAGVMLEPIFGTGTIPMTKEFIQKLRQVTKRVGVPLMFDEVITGFRMALGGAQEYFGIEPDIATYGKIIGGGLPIGAVGCSTEYMEKILSEDLSISIAGTFSGNPLTLAAGYALLGYLMENQHLYQELNAKGDRLRDGFNEFARAKGWPATMTGLASVFQTHFKEPPIETPRDTLDPAHSDENVEEVLRVHQIAVESSLTSHGVI